MARMLGLISLVGACACSSVAPDVVDAGGSDTSSPPMDNDAQAVDSAPDSPSQNDSGGCAPVDPGGSGIRLANMGGSTQMFKPVDVCIAAQSAPYTMPLLASKLALTGGLASEHVSAFVPLQPDTYKARVIPATSTCSDTSLGVEIASLELKTNEHQTIVIGGWTPSKNGVEKPVPYSAKAFRDELVPTADKAHVRVLNVSPYVTAPSSVSYAAGLGMEMPLYSTFPYLDLSTGPTIDSNAYTDVDEGIVHATVKWNDGQDRKMTYSAPPVFKCEVHSMFLAGYYLASTFNDGLHLFLCNDAKTLNGETVCTRI